MKLHIIFFLFLIISPFAKGSNDVIIDIKSPEKHRVEKNISYIKDVSGRLTIEEVKGLSEFNLTEKKVPNFGIQKAVFWFKITLKNSTSEYLHLEIAHPILNEVYFYDPLERGGTPLIDGQNTPFSKKNGSFTNIVFDLKILPGKTKTYFLKVKSLTQIQLPLYIGSEKALRESNNLNKLFAAIFFGVMLSMIFYNLAIYFIVNDTSYLYYVIFVAVILIVQLVPKGFAHQFFWPESSNIANAAMFFSPAMSGTASILFFMSFLNAKQYAPKLRKVLIGLICVYGVGLIFYAFNIYSLSYTVLDVTSLIASLLMLAGAFLIYKKGNKSALFFLIAWSVFLAGVIIYVMKEVGVLPHNFITNYTMMIGSGLETILLSIGLANRINILKREKEMSKEKELEALQKNEKLIREQKFMLEQQVEERTEELKLALESIQKAQDKLIESEKMASIGQLTAGIAHEINNPINYVTSNIASLDRDLAEIQGVIKAYSEIDDTNFSEKIKEIEKLKNELDFEYLQEEIPMLLEGIKEGANRTANIVSSLRVFSNKDKERKSLVDLTVGIDSSITLLSNKLDDIEVITNYELDKEVYCFPGKLNQVFMNILANAIDAIRERQSESGFKGLISVHVFEKEDHFICVTIEDNGIGMDEETKKKIFDPFFSSKDVGAGTGLGMSLTYQFIKLHSGEIKIDSTLNQGTKITVCIKNVEDYE